MKQFLKILIFLVFAVFLIGGNAMALTITADGSMSDWGMSASTGFFTSDIVGVPIIGQDGNGVSYWEEDGVLSGGYIEPGYGAQLYDIEGLYFTEDANNFYFAVVTGMPAAGDPVDNHYLGDIFFGENLKYAIATTPLSGEITGGLYL